MPALTDVMIQNGVDAAERELREIVAVEYPDVSINDVLSGDLKAAFHATQARLVRAALAEVVPLVVERCANIADDYAVRMKTTSLKLAREGKSAVVALSKCEAGTCIATAIRADKEA